jgi:hypothetical protein
LVTRATSSAEVVPEITFIQPSLRNVVMPFRTAAFFKSQELAFSWAKRRTSSVVTSNS